MTGMNGIEQERKAHLGSFAGMGFSQSTLAEFFKRPQAETQIGAARQGWDREGP